MLQRMSIPLVQVKAGNNSEDLLNEIRQIVYALYQSKEIIRKVYNDIIKSIQLQKWISKTSELHALILKLTDKLDLRRAEKIIALSNLSICYTWKNIQISYSNNKLKISAPTRNDKFELPGGSYYFEYILKKHGENTDKLSVQIYANKIENRDTFKIIDGYSVELLTRETMKLLGSTENKITKDENGKNVSHLEITEVVLVHFNFVNNDYLQDSRVLYTFLPNKPFGSLLENSPTNHVFLKTFSSEFQGIGVSK